MGKYRYIDELLQPKAHLCAHPGCREAGTHRAPLSPTKLNEYQWLCLEHVQKFNKQWDYFKEKTQEEIEAFQKSAFTGHRPTWRISAEGPCSTEKLHAALDAFMGRKAEAARSAAFQPPVNPKQRKALEQLELEHPASFENIKKRYKTLVKQYHPDRNQGNKHAEERFKLITEAYRYLIDHYCDTIPNV